MQTTDEEGTGQGTTMGGGDAHHPVTRGKPDTAIRYQRARTAQMNAAADMAEVWADMTLAERQATIR